MKSTVKNLEGNNSICLAVWNSEWNGYKISGTAEYHTAGKWREFVQELPENKGFAAKGAVVVNIEEIKELG
jgi:predicted pyridoxine 5'-phosphate oxidase superfamily flavin-nucleotide-binding protein